MSEVERFWGPAGKGRFDLIEMPEKLPPTHVPSAQVPAQVPMYQQAPPDQQTTMLPGPRPATDQLPPQIVIQGPQLSHTMSAAQQQYQPQNHEVL